MDIKQKLKQINWIYVVVMIVALTLAFTRYSTSSVLQTIIVLYCIVQLVFIGITVYNILKKKLRNQDLTFSRWQVLILVFSFATISISFVYVLTDYFRSFVITYSGMILGVLLIYDLGKMVLKKN